MKSWGILKNTCSQLIKIFLTICFLPTAKAYSCLIKLDYSMIKKTISFSSWGLINPHTRVLASRKSRENGIAIKIKLVAKTEEPKEENSFNFLKLHCFTLILPKDNTKLKKLLLFLNTHYLD